MRESAELRDLMLQFYQAMNDGDMAAYIDRVASRQPGATFLGTDPNEVWDLAGMRQAGLAQVEAGLRADPGNPTAYAEGDMGWAVDPSAVMRLGEQEVPVRVTCVCQRESGDWKMVHFHASIGVPNEEAVGQELPT